MDNQHELDAINEELADGTATIAQAIRWRDTYNATASLNSRAVVWSHEGLAPWVSIISLA